MLDNKLGNKNCHFITFFKHINLKTINNYLFLKTLYFGIFFVYIKLLSTILWKIIMPKGFTLIELMIVVAIIGILAAIAIPAYQNYTARAQISEALVISSRFKMEISSTYGEKSRCPTLTDLGVPTGIIDGKYVSSVAMVVQTGTLCSVQFTFKTTGVNSSISGKHINLSMLTYTAGNGSSEWSCTSTDIAQQLLPTTCKKI